MTALATQPAALKDAESAPALHAVSLSKIIDERPVLRELTFDVGRGLYAALLGANGAGKSTLLKTLGTLVPLSHGTLQLFGRCAAREAAYVRSRLGMIGHNAMLYRDMSAQENLVFFGRLYDVADPAQRASELLEYVGLAERAHDQVKTFSRGMVQRVAIARALMHDPDLILADEPFTGLDAPSRELLESMLRKLHAEGRTILLANHDIEQSLALCEQALVLRRGRLVMNAPSRELDAGAVMAEVRAG